MLTVNFKKETVNFEYLGIISPNSCTWKLVSDTMAIMCAGK